jgi:hypothetical protein
MNPDDPPELNDVLDALIALLAAVPGLTVAAGLAWRIGQTPFAYAACEGLRFDAAAQILVTRAAYLVRVLVPWADQWETSERALAPFLDTIPRRLLAIDALGPALVDAASMRIDASERGDGVLFIPATGQNYRSAAIRFEVTL